MLRNNEMSTENQLFALILDGLTPYSEIIGIFSINAYIKFKCVGVF